MLFAIILLIFSLIAMLVGFALYTNDLEYTIDLLFSAGLGGQTSTKYPGNKKQKNKRLKYLGLLLIVLGFISVIYMLYEIFKLAGPPKIPQK